MPVCDSAATSERVVEAFASQIKGRTFVITGAGQPSICNSIATELAKASLEHIVIASRTASRTASIVDPVLAGIRGIDASVKTSFVQIDLSAHASVRQAAQKLLEKTGSQIDVLSNSAGVMALKEYADNISHFLLTNMLAPALLATGAQSPDGARVVSLTSAGY